MVVALLVAASPGDGPGKLRGLLALVHERLALGADDVHGLRVSADHLHTVAGVDSILTECAKFRFDNHFANYCCYLLI